MDLSECLVDDTRVSLVHETKYNKKRWLSSKPNLYVKKFNHAEFIGEELCAIRNIRCTHYFLVGLGLYQVNRTANYGNIKRMGYNYMIGSYDFKKSDRNYRYISDYNLGLSDDNLEAMLNQTVSFKNKMELRDDMFEMLALDIYMGQVDRTHSNFMFEEDVEHNIRLAPLYDFEYSLKQNYLSRGMLSYGDLYAFRDIDECKKFVSKYPSFKYVLESYLDVDLLDAIACAYRRRGMVVPDDKWEFYSEFEKDRDKSIQKVLKRN